MNKRPVEETSSKMAWAIGNPQQNAALKELIEHQYSDRVIAIVGGAILEDALKVAVTLRFRSTVDHGIDINEKLFRVGGPLGFFMPKVDLAYQLYMFEKPIRNAMYGIGEIRNLFAHQLDMTFESTDRKMVEAGNKLTLHQGRTHYPNPFTGQDLPDTPITEPLNLVKDRFIVNLKLCLLCLMGDRSRHLLWTNIPKLSSGRST